MPETLAPPFPPLTVLWWWWWLSGIPAGSDGNLHDGVMIGKDRKTERKTRTILGLLCFFFWEGWMREIVWGNGIGGGGGEGG